jgi:hypothetical protein
VALSAYIFRQEELPTPSPFQDGQELLTVQPVIAAQLDLYTAMREQGISQADLAERLGISSGAAEKLLSLDYCTPLSQVNQALLAVGGRPAVENQAA